MNSELGEIYFFDNGHTRCMSTLKKLSHVKQSKQEGRNINDDKTNVYGN